LARARGAAVSVADIRALRADEAARIYRERYWNAVRGDDLPSGLDLAVFDLAVNSGPGRAARLLQAVLAVPVDGIVGPVTLEAARRSDCVRAIRILTESRLRFLSGLSAWPVFGRGWRRRALATERAALVLAHDQPLTQPQTEIPMIDTKRILASRTIWANVIGLAAVGIGLLGFDTSRLDPSAFADAMVELIAAASFIGSTVFRIAATKQLAR
jgi:lysozyme family protein